jgi:predicted dehydrogenase
MTKKLRVGVAGAGFIGAVHAQACRQVADIEVVGIADPIAEKAEPLARATGGRVFRNYDELLKAGVDVLSVCLPPALHLPAAEAAAQAGAHVLMEKPMARTLAEADAMIGACRKGGVNLMVGFTHHFYPEMVEARRLVGEGVIGRPLIVLDNMSITYSFVLPWYRDKEINGGGVFMCNAVHGFDRACWVLNQKVTGISAIIEPTSGRRAEDYGAALARFDGGAQGNFFQHWGPYPTVQCELQVFGEEGMVHVRSWDSVEVLAGETRTIKRFYSPSLGLPERTMVGLVAELSEMMNSVRGGRAPSVGGAEGRAGLAAVLAVYESSATGQWVAVD